jgi:hypothetical protein
MTYNAPQRELQLLHGAHSAPGNHAVHSHARPLPAFPERLAVTVAIVAFMTQLEQSKVLASTLAPHIADGINPAAAVIRFRDNLEAL